MNQTYDISSNFINETVISFANNDESFSLIIKEGFNNSIVFLLNLFFWKHYFKQFLCLLFICVYENTTDIFFILHSGKVKIFCNEILLLIPMPKNII